MLLHKSYSYHHLSDSHEPHCTSCATTNENNTKSWFDTTVTSGTTADTPGDHNSGVKILGHPRSIPYLNHHRRIGVLEDRYLRTRTHIQPPTPVTTKLGTKTEPWRSRTSSNGWNNITYSTYLGTWHYLEYRMYMTLWNSLLNNWERQVGLPGTSWDYVKPLILKKRSQSRHHRRLSVVTSPKSNTPKEGTFRRP